MLHCALRCFPIGMAMSCFQCSLCHQPLSLHDACYRCVGQHSFDLAKDGYVNLLPVQFKHSKDPGDALLMMAVRCAFLDAGHYQPLRDRVIAAVAALTPEPGLRWLDIGCGEGYYIAALVDQLKHHSRKRRFMGWISPKMRCAAPLSAIGRSASASPQASGCRSSMHHWTVSCAFMRRAIPPSLGARYVRGACC